MLGAFGKSAQFPLYVWLPDAMEGPTPVSALIHAATMVTAGVYMIARCGTLFVSSHAAMVTIAAVGAFTALFAATIALRQFDLKKVFAYSTVSQLGYMFVAVGVLAPTAAVFHLVTHAFFKALLFLSAGVVMHAMLGHLDLRKMSGLKRQAAQDAVGHPDRLPGLGRVPADQRVLLQGPDRRLRLRCTTTTSGWSCSGDVVPDGVLHVSALLPGVRGSGAGPDHARPTRAASRPRAVGDRHVEAQGPVRRGPRQPRGRPPVADPAVGTSGVDHAAAATATATTTPSRGLMLWPLYVLAAGALLIGYRLRAHRWPDFLGRSPSLHPGVRDVGRQHVRLVGRQPNVDPRGVRPSRCSPPTAAARPFESVRRCCWAPSCSPWASRWRTCSTCGTAAPPSGWRPGCGR